MGLLDVVANHSASGGLIGGLVRLVLRFLQFVFAITVAGLYGADVDNRSNIPSNLNASRWIYALVVAIFSLITVLIYAIPFVKSYWGFGWDWILFILWVAVFGTFGDIYINSNLDADEPGQNRMYNAVWIDLINMLLWFVTAIYSTIIWWRSRGSRSLHTGRAKV